MVGKFSDVLAIFLTLSQKSATTALFPMVGMT